MNAAGRSSRCMITTTSCLGASCYGDGCLLDDGKAGLGTGLLMYHWVVEEAEEWSWTRTIVKVGRLWYSCASVARTPAARATRNAELRILMVCEVEIVMVMTVSYGWMKV